MAGLGWFKDPDDVPREDNGAHYSLRLVDKDKVEVLRVSRAQVDELREEMGSSLQDALELIAKMYGR